MNKSQNRTHPRILNESIINDLYQQYLGRLPESESIYKYHLNKHNSAEELISEIEKSDEYKKRLSDNAAWQKITSIGYSIPQTIDVDVDKCVLMEMFQRTQKQWAALGETEPYWSVISSPEYKSSKFNANKSSFFASGKASADLIDHFSLRNGYRRSGGTLLELGCGVGRITLHLAKKFDQVIAVDISAGNLALCRAHAAEAGLDNVTTILLQCPSQLAELPSFDFLFSIIVLQHNPPPVSAFCLDHLLSRTNQDGAVLFQIPTHTPGYKFIASEYLSSKHPPNGMEMHCLPMNKIYAMLKTHRFSVQETLADSWTGWPGSHTFFATKTE